MLKNKIILFTCLLICASNQIYPSQIGNRILGSGNYGTHITPLMTAILNTNGPILELGCGDFSTPILHTICATQKRFLLSAESDENWMNLFMDLQNDWHQFKLIKSLADWAKIGNDTHWSVVLVDHAPGAQRLVDIKRLRQNTDIFVVHDTEDSWQWFYGYYPYITTFKYKYRYTRYQTETTLLSDTVDVAKFFVN